MNKEWLKQAGARAIRTGAQTFLTMVTVGQKITELDWVDIAGVIIVAMLYSIATSIALGMPENGNDGKIELSESEDGKGMNAEFSLNFSMEELKEKDTITLKIDKK